jgi:predicted deacylase
VGGIVTIQDIFKRARKRLVKGALYAFPLMNPTGFEAGTRDMTYSKEDINRAFPGDRTGSLGERIAYRIFSRIVETKPTLVLDLHNDWRRSIPYTLVDAIPDMEKAKAFQDTKVAAAKSGFIIVLDTDRLEGSLSYSLVRHGIPSLTLELGASHVIDEGNIEYGVRSIWNILTHLGMVEPREEPFQYPLDEALRGRILRYSYKPRSSSTGIVRFLSKPGDSVKKGQVTARVYNAFGKVLESVTALSDSIVLGHSDSSVALPGMAVMAFAEI